MTVPYSFRETTHAQLLTVLTHSFTPNIIVYETALQVLPSDSVQSRNVVEGGGSRHTKWEIKRESILPRAQQCNVGGYQEQEGRLEVKLHFTIGQNDSNGVIRRVVTVR